MSKTTTGVLLVNLGTPDSPSTADVRRYLSEFLSDPDVVDVNRVLWWPLLNGVILPRRAPRSAELYRRIWSDAGSPLLAICKRQCELVAAELGPRCVVRLGMRYGAPSLASAVDDLIRAGADTVVLVSLFPQYSASTFGSVCKAVAGILAPMASPPRLRVIPPYYADEGYVDAVATRIRESSGDARVDHFVFSFHGLPRAYVERGDPYARQCEATSGRLAAALGISREAWSVMYQSRFGSEPWLEPYAEDFIPRLAATHRRVVVAAPGFTADCLETLEDLRLRLRAAFRDAGGDDLVVVPALNDHPRWIRAVADLVQANLD